MSTRRVSYAGMPHSGSLILASISQISRIKRLVSFSKRQQFSTIVCAKLKTLQS